MSSDNEFARGNGADDLKNRIENSIDHCMSEWDSISINEIIGVLERVKQEFINIMLHMDEEIVFEDDCEGDIN